MKALRWALSGGEADDGAEGLDETEDGGGDEGASKPGKCRCVDGEALDCPLSKTDGAPLFKHRAVAAVCGIKVTRCVN